MQQDIEQLNRIKCEDKKKVIPRRQKSCEEHPKTLGTKHGEGLKQAGKKCDEILPKRSRLKEGQRPQSAKSRIIRGYDQVKWSVCNYWGEFLRDADYYSVH